MHRYFCRSHDFGFQTFETREEAKATAQEMINDYREEARREGEWIGEDIDTICWGEIYEHSVEVPVPSSEDPEHSNFGVVDFELQEPSDDGESCEDFHEVTGDESSQGYYGDDDE